VVLSTRITRQPAGPGNPCDEPAQGPARGPAQRPALGAAAGGQIKGKLHGQLWDQFKGWPWDEFWCQFEGELRIQLGDQFSERDEDHDWDEDEGRDGAEHLQSVFPWNDAYVLAFDGCVLPIAGRSADFVSAR
jgi:hypothetical protein